MKEDIKESYQENAVCIRHSANTKRNTDVDLEKSKNWKIVALFCMLHFLSIPNLIWWYKRGMKINFDIKKIIKGQVLGDQPFIFSLFDDNALLDPVFTFVFKGFIFSNFRVCYLKCLGFFYLSPLAILTWKVLRILQSSLCFQWCVCFLDCKNSHLSLLLAVRLKVP